MSIILKPISSLYEEMGFFCFIPIGIFNRYLSVEIYALTSRRVSNIRESRRNGSCHATVTGNEVCNMPLESRLNCLD